MWELILLSTNKLFSPRYSTVITTRMDNSMNGFGISSFIGSCCHAFWQFLSRNSLIFIHFTQNDSTFFTRKFFCSTAFRSISHKSILVCLSHPIHSTTGGPITTKFREKLWSVNPLAALIIQMKGAVQFLLWQAMCEYFFF